MEFHFYTNVFLSPALSLSLIFLILPPCCPHAGKLCSLSLQLWGPPKPQIVRSVLDDIAATPAHRSISDLFILCGFVANLHEYNEFVCAVVGPLADSRATHALQWIHVVINTSFRPWDNDDGELGVWQLLRIPSLTDLYTLDTQYSTQLAVMDTGRRSNACLLRRSSRGFYRQD